MTSQNDRSGIWFALGADGDVHYLGHCGDFEAAEASANDLGIDAVWIADAEQARQWQTCLSLLDWLGDRVITATSHGTTT